jgi:hypothetical protein
MVLGILKKPLIRYKTRILRRLIGGADMNELTILHGAEPRDVLKTVIEKKIPAIMSYLSRSKWHVTKVLLTNLGANRLNVQLSPSMPSPATKETHKPLPINIQVNQPVGISLKYGYGKFIFETTVVALEPSSDSTSSGTIVLLVPDRIEMVQRRSYFRVNVPGSLKVNVMLWHRRCTDEIPQSLTPSGVDAGQQTTSPGKGQSKSKAQIPNVRRTPPECYWQGRLADISAGGLQVVIDNGQEPDFKKGQFLGLRFTPMPYEMPLMFNAQIRNILPTVDQKSICLGLQIVGLEASPEGRHVLQRLCNVVEHYYQMNQRNPKGQDFQTASLLRVETLNSD